MTTTDPSDTCTPLDYAAEYPMLRKMLAGELEGQLSSYGLEAVQAAFSAACRISDEAMRTLMLSTLSRQLHLEVGRQRDGIALKELRLRLSTEQPRTHAVEELLSSVGSVLDLVTGQLRAVRLETQARDATLGAELFVLSHNVEGLKSDLKARVIRMYQSLEAEKRHDSSGPSEGVDGP